MAEWKKVIVSGSTANLASAQIDDLVSGVVTGSADGTLGIQAINGTGNIVATTGATGLSASGSFSGSFEGFFQGVTNLPDLTQSTGITAFTYDGSSPATIAVSGAAELSLNAVTKWNNAAGKFVDSSLTDNGTTITGATSIQLTGANSTLSGSFSGSFHGDGADLTGIVTTLDISGSNGAASLSVKTQDLSFIETANETTVVVSTIGSGVQVQIGLPDDVTIGKDLIVTGDLTVNGTTTTLNTTNVLVEDRFIILNAGSGSAAPTNEGGIIVEGTTPNVGEAFFFDNTKGRWGVASGVAQDATSVTQAASTVLVIEDTIANATSAGYDDAGNMVVNGGDIYIYV